MRKTLVNVVTLMVMMALVLSACGGKKEPTAKPKAKATNTVVVQQAVPTSKPAEPYLVGAFVSTSGSLASLGQPEADTLTMMVAQINAEGGVKGPDGLMHPLELRMYDDQSDVNKAAELAKTLIDTDKVTVIIGGTGSDQSLAVVPIVTEAKIPYISLASTDRLVDPIAERQYVFKIPMRLVIASRVQIDWAKAHGITKIASLGVNTTFGKGTMAALKTAAAEGGIEIVYEATFEPKSTDFTAQFEALAASPAEAVFVGATTDDAVPFTKAYREKAIALPLMHYQAIANAAFVQSAGEAANNVLFPAGKLLVADQLPDSDPQKAIMLQYQADYKAKYNKDASVFGGHAWDAIMILKGAFEKVGNGAEAIRGYMETDVQNFVGISGIFTFTNTDHAGLTKESFVLLKVVDGKWAYVAPADYAKVP